MIQVSGLGKGKLQRLVSDSVFVFHSLVGLFLLTEHVIHVIQVHILWQIDQSDCGKIQTPYTTV